MGTRVVRRVEVERVVVEEEDEDLEDVKEVVGDEVDLEFEVGEELIEAVAVDEASDVVETLDREESVGDVLVIMEDEEDRPIEAVLELEDRDDSRDAYAVASVSAIFRLVFI